MQKYSIQETMNALGLSRVTISSRVRKLGIETTKQGKQAFISETDFERLKAVGKTSHIKKGHVKQHMNEHVNMNELALHLQEENAFLKKQLSQCESREAELFEILRNQGHTILDLQRKNTLLLENQTIPGMIKKLLMRK